MPWTNLTKSVSTYVNGIKEKLISFLLQEDGAYLLMEDGGKIILEDHSFDNNDKNSSTYNHPSKASSVFSRATKQLSSWTNLPKN